MSQQPDEEAIFNAARKIGEAEARALYLRHACSDDAALHARVQALLQIHDEDRSFLAPPVLPLGATVDEPIRERPGTVLGPYKLLEQIGVGGFGVVFMAEQQQPLRRKVAVKVIKPGMDTRQVIARFEAERQALALMDHPNIARVLDAGETASGQPFFVMELVRGLPITDYCDQNRLTPRQRLELFIRVCQAVQHAHHKGIIHRDIKPSNVLVTLHDGVPVVKVIDFGIAKATGQQLTEKTLFTNFAQMVGTPLYMSPEQAEMSGLDVDTRSDIYSLGVLLYELLTGTTPFDRQRLHDAAFDEVRRIIREEEPPRPSTRLSASVTLPNIAAQRRTDPKLLRRLFRGEVDWIVMKALDKDRSRRYDTAGSLVRDIERYLGNEPVEACPPSTLYRFRKFARRNKGLLASAAVIALALLVGTAVSTWQAIRATEAEGLAADRLETAQANALAAEQAETRATRWLYDARLAQAQAGRFSRRVGQRFDSLDAVAQATTIARDLKLGAAQSLELRNTAIACLALPDLRLGKPRAAWPTGQHHVDFDGRLEQVACADAQAVRIYRMADGSLVAQLPCTAAESWPLFSRDGKFLAVAATDLTLWQLDGAAPRIVVQVPAGDNHGVDFSADSRQCALGHADGSISLHDLATGQPPRRLAGRRGLSVLAFQPGGRHLAMAGPASVQICNLATDQVVVDLPQPSTVSSLAWHPDGTALAVACVGPARVSLWEVPSGKQTLALEGLRNGGINIAFNHAGDRLVSTGWHGKLRLWDSRTGQQLCSADSGLDTPRFSLDDRLLSGDVRDGKLRLWEVAACREYRTLARAPTAGKVEYEHAVIHADGRLLAVGTAAGVGLWDLATAQELDFLKSPGSTWVFFEPSGALLTNGSAGLQRWPIHRDPKSPGLLRIGPPHRLPVAGPVCRIASSADGRVLAVSQFQGGCVLHADRPDHPVALGPHDDARGIAVSPDGRWVATGSHSRTGVNIWHSHTGKPVTELLPRHGSNVNFSSDGKWLLTSGGGCRLWTVGSWQQGPSLGGDFGVFSPDSKMLAVAAGVTVRLVAPDTGREFARLEDPNQDRPRHMSFSPDGTQLVATNDDSRSIHVWDLRTIRKELAGMGLDWDLPAYPPEAVLPPLRVQVTQPPLVYLRAKQWDKGIDAYRQAVANSPNDDRILNNLAWLLATCPDAKYRVPGRAVELAQQAVNLKPLEATYWNTLGVAHYRASDCKAAIAALTKSNELFAGQNLAFNAFFLAMAHWHLGHPEQARTWHDEASQWMDKHQPQDDELRHFRAEAAKLLQGVPDKVGR